MKNLITILSVLFFLQFLCFNASGQDKIIPYVSVGAMHHLGRGGVNVELGGECEVIKRFSVSGNYRHSYLVGNLGSKINIDALALNLSWIVINKNNNRLSVSTGINAGRYYSLSFNSMDKINPRYEKQYYNVWWNPAKIQYDYTFSNKVMIGAYLGFYRDDGDNSNLLGFVIGYKL